MSEFFHHNGDDVFFDKKTIMMSAGRGRTAQPVVMYHTIAPLRNKQHPYAAPSLSRNYAYCVDDKHFHDTVQGCDDTYATIVDTLSSSRIGQTNTFSHWHDTTLHVVDNPYSYGNGGSPIIKTAHRPPVDDGWHPCFSTTFSLMHSPSRAVVISIRSTNAYDSDIDGLSTFKGCFSFAASVCDPDTPWLSHNFLFMFSDDDHLSGDIREKTYTLSSSTFVPTLNELITHIFVEADLFRHHMVNFGPNGYYIKQRSEMKPASVVLLLDNATETLASLSKTVFDNGLDDDTLKNYAGDPLYKNLYDYKKGIILSERNGFLLVSPVHNTVTGKRMPSNYYRFRIHVRTPKVLASKKNWKMEHICDELQLPMPERYDTTLNSSIHCWYNDPDRFIRTQWELTQLPLEYVSWIFGQGFIPPTTIVSMTNPVSSRIMRQNFTYDLHADGTQGWKNFSSYISELNYRGFFYPNPHDDRIPRDYRTKILNGFNFHAETIGTTFSEIEPVRWYRKAYSGGLNTCYMPGFFQEHTYDYDMSSAYPIALSLIPDVQWYVNPELGAFQNNDPNGDFDQREREKQSTTYRKVTYNRAITLNDLRNDCAQIFSCRADFPDDCYQPNFRDAWDKSFHDVHSNSYIFPQHTTMDIRTRYEVEIALHMGANVYAEEAIEIPYATSSDGSLRYTARDILRVYMSDRFKAQTEGCNSGIFKLAANSQYGKMAQDVSNFSGLVNNCYNQIANPYLVSCATSLVRSLLAQAVTEVHRLGYTVYSATTDGFITNAPEHVVRSLDLNGMRSTWEKLLSELSHGAETHMWSKKHQQNELLNVTTRFNVALNEDGVCAHGGLTHYPSVTPDSREDRLHTWNQAILSNGVNIPVAQIREMKFSTVGNYDIPYFHYITLKSVSAEFDGKRQPIFSTAHIQSVHTVGSLDERRTEGRMERILSFDTRPWGTVDEYMTMRKLSKKTQFVRGKHKNDATNVSFTGLYSNIRQMAAAYSYLSASTRRTPSMNRDIIKDTFVENIIMHCILRDTIFLSLPLTHDEGVKVAEICHEINAMVGSDFATTGRWSHIRRLLNADNFIPLNADVERDLLDGIMSGTVPSRDIVTSVFGDHDKNLLEKYSFASEWYLRHHFPGVVIDAKEFARQIFHDLGASAFATPTEVQRDFLRSDYWHAVIDETLRKKGGKRSGVSKSVVESVIKGGASPEILKKVSMVRHHHRMQRADMERARKGEARSATRRTKNIPYAWETPLEGAMRNHNIIRSFRRRLCDRIYRMQERNHATEEEIRWYRNQEVYMEWAHRVQYRASRSYAMNKDVFMVLNRVGKWGQYLYGDSEWLALDLTSTIDKTYNTASVRRVVNEYMCAREEWLLHKNVDGLSEMERFSAEFSCDKTERLVRAERQLHDIEGLCRLSPDLRNMRVENLPFHFYRITSNKEKQRQQMRDHNPRYFLFAHCDVFS